MEEVEREIVSALALAREINMPRARDFWQNTPNDAEEMIVALAK